MLGFNFYCSQANHFAKSINIETEGHQLIRRHDSCWKFGISTAFCANRGNRYLCCLKLIFPLLCRSKLLCPSVRLVFLRSTYRPQFLIHVDAIWHTLTCFDQRTNVVGRGLLRIIFSTCAHITFRFKNLLHG